MNAIDRIGSVVSVRRFDRLAARRAMKRACGSMKAMAPMVECTEGHLSAILTGRRRPSKDLVERIARICDVPTARLYASGDDEDAMRANEEIQLIAELLWKLPPDLRAQAFAFIRGMLQGVEEKADSE